MPSHWTPLSYLSKQGATREHQGQGHGAYLWAAPGPTSMAGCTLTSSSSSGGGGWRLWEGHLPPQACCMHLRQMAGWTSHTFRRQYHAAPPNIEWLVQGVSIDAYPSYGSTGIMRCNSCISPSWCVSAEHTFGPLGGPPLPPTAHPCLGEQMLLGTAIHNAQNP